MRYSLMATVAASALAIGIGFGPAAAFSPIGNTVDSESVLLTVQRGERDTHAGRGKSIRSGRDSMRRGDRGRRGTEFRSGGRDGYGYGRGGVDFDFFAGPSYGYVSDCAWLRRRAVATGSSYWWRRYRACL
jgi:hypothetical protein